MLTADEFIGQVSGELHILDGATGSNLRKMGMPREAVTEAWVLAHPEILQQLQRQYVAAGSQILIAPTFQAQPIALERIGLAQDTERVNAQLVGVTKAVAEGALVAGDLTTLAGFCDSWDEGNFDFLVENYRRQIRGLIDGGADLLIAETLLYPTEAEAILTAAELEKAGATVYSFTMQPDGSLFSGREAGPILRDLEKAGAAAVGFNCVAASNMTPALVSKLRRYVKIPLFCKPNAGEPVINDQGQAIYPMGPAEFAAILAQCRQMGADLVGGCCGTDPEYIRCL